MNNLNTKFIQFFLTTYKYFRCTHIECLIHDQNVACIDKTKSLLFSCCSANSSELPTSSFLIFFL